MFFNTQLYSVSGKPSTGPRKPVTLTWSEGDRKAVRPQSSWGLWCSLLYLLKRIYYMPHHIVLSIVSRDARSQHSYKTQVQAKDWWTQKPPNLAVARVVETWLLQLGH